MKTRKVPVWYLLEKERRERIERARHVSTAN